MMRLKNVALGVLAVLAAVTCRASFADTIKLTSVSNQAVAGAYVYPYSLSLNGDTSTPMMCINYDDHVTVGESWQVTGSQVSTASSTALQEDAWLFSQIGKGTYSNADIQFAVWSILSPSATSSAGYDAAARQLVSLAAAAVPGLTNSFLSQYTIYTPVTTTAAMATWTEGLPQSFIAYDPVAVTPEPSSLFLLGTGLCGVSMLLMRRRSLHEERGVAA